MTLEGQTRSFSDVGSISGLPEAGIDGAIYERPRLLPGAKLALAALSSSTAGNANPAGVTSGAC